MIATLTGKQIKFPSWNVWVPYLWMLGIMIFSTGGFVGGAAGEPRRTNLGVSYANPQSPLYHADWQFSRICTTVGGILMTIAALIFFVVFFATLFGKGARQGDAELIVSSLFTMSVCPRCKLPPWLIGAAPRHRLRAAYCPNHPGGFPARPPTR